MNLKIILITLFLVPSVNAVCQINNTWISKYYTYISRQDTFKHDVAKDIIWIIENDKATTIQFERISPYGEPEVSVEVKVDTAEIKIENNNMILIRNGAIDRVGFTLSNEELIIIDNKRDKKTAFEKLPTFNQASNKSKFEEFLKNNSFKEPEEGGMVGFRENHSLVLSNLRHYGRDNPYWIIEEIENEILLVLVGREVSLCQIVEFDEEGFSLLFYYYDPGFKQLRFEKIEKAVEYDKEDLIGEWEIQVEVNEQAPTDSDSLRYIQKELLIFNDSTLINKFDDTSRTSKWKLDLENEVLLLPQFYDDMMRHQWNIEHLTKEKLIIERRKRKPDRNTDTYFEIVEFLKKT